MGRTRGDTAACGANSDDCCVGQALPCGGSLLARHRKSPSQLRIHDIPHILSCICNTRESPEGLGRPGGSSLGRRRASQDTSPLVSRPVRVALFADEVAHSAVIGTTANGGKHGVPPTMKNAAAGWGSSQHAARRASQSVTLWRMKSRACLIAISCFALSCKGSSGGPRDGGISGGTGGSGGGVPAALAQACVELATSQCGKQQVCSPSSFRYTYSDFDTCVARMQLTCPTIASAPGSGYSAGTVSACAKALASATCADVGNNLGPAECRIRGSLGLGAACIHDSQCAGTENFCQLSGQCGVCAARKPQSGQTSFSDCGSSLGCRDGLVCSLGRCLPTVAATDPCDLGHPCPVPLACDTGKCIPTTLGAGATCDVYGSACDDSQGLVCLDNVCIVRPTANLGETCGLQGNLVTFCLAGTVCDVAHPNYLGKCQPPLADGDPCDDQPYVYDLCQPPATCTDGFCNLPEPLACASPDAGRD